MFGPGEYMPDPTEGIVDVKDLPVPKRMAYDRHHKHTPCPRCGHLASRHPSNSHFGFLRGRQPQPRVMIVPQPPGSAAILAASGAGETPALPGKAGPEVQWCTFLFKMRIAAYPHRPVFHPALLLYGRVHCRRPVDAAVGSSSDVRHWESLHSAFQTGGTLLDFEPAKVREHFRQEFAKGQGLTAEGPEAAAPEQETPAGL